LNLLRVEVTSSAQTLASVAYLYTPRVLAVLGDHRAENFTPGAHLDLLGFFGRAADQVAL